MRILAFLFGSFAYINVFIALGTMALSVLVLVAVTPEMILEQAQRLSYMSSVGLRDIHRFLESGGLERWSLYVVLYLFVTALQSVIAIGAWWCLQTLALEWHQRRRLTPALIQHLKKLTWWLGAGSGLTLAFVALDAYLGLFQAMLELSAWFVKNSLQPAEAIDQFALLINEAMSPSQFFMQQVTAFVSLSGTVVLLLFVVSYACSKWAQHWMELQRRQESLEAENALIV